MFNVLLFGVHGLTRGDGYHVVDVVDRATAREVVDRTCDTLQNRTDGDGITQTLNHLITDVSNLKVRHQHLEPAQHQPATHRRSSDQEPFPWPDV